MRRRHSVAPILLALAAVLGPAGCSDDPSGLPLPAADLQGLVVTSARGLARTEPRAYLSLAQLSSAAGSEVVVTNRVSGVSVRRPLVNGGFDPLGIDALPGDELRIEILGTPTRILRMAAPLPPVIVRTDPARKRRSVPLNSILTVVFSEPIDPRSVTGASIRLLGPAGAETTVLDLAGEGTIVTVRPLAPMRPGSDYRLEVATTVADLGGQELQAPESIEFTTAAIDEAPVAAVRICPDSLRIPVGVTSGFVVVVDSGTRVIRSFPDPELSWSSSDTTIVRADGSGVHTIAKGRAYVMVTYRGDTDSAEVIVTDWPPPGPFRLWPGGAVMPIGHTTRFEVSHPDNTPAPVVTWTVSDASIISVDDSGNVTGRGAGTAWVHARSGTDHDSADVEVYDPAPKLGQLYVMRPDSVLFQPGDLVWLAVSGPDNPAPPVTWSVANTAIATVSPSGAITAHALGRTTVSARFSDGSETTANVIVVQAGSLGHINLTPLAPTVFVGDTLRFTVNFDARAQELWGNQGSSWTLAGPALTMVMHQAGVFVARAAGTATVRTYAGPLWAQTTVTVLAR